MHLGRGNYETHNSDLRIVIHNVPYQNKVYAKVKLSLVNKHNDIIYEMNRNYKVYKANIKHWKRVA